MVTGAGISTSFRALTQSKMRPLGMSLAVFTEAMASLPPVTRTVLVTMRVGLVTSLRAYASPRGQVLPVTLTTSPFSISTVMGQPMGHPMQIRSIFSMVYASSRVTVMWSASGWSSSSWAFS